MPLCSQLTGTVSGKEGRETLISSMVALVASCVSRPCTFPPCSSLHGVFTRPMRYFRPFGTPCPTCFQTRLRFKTEPSKFQGVIHESWSSRFSKVAVMESPKEPQLSFPEWGTATPPPSQRQKTAVHTAKHRTIEYQPRTSTRRSTMGPSLPRLAARAVFLFGSPTPSPKVAV